MGAKGCRGLRLSSLQQCRFHNLPTGRQARLGRRQAGQVTVRGGSFDSAPSAAGGRGYAQDGGAKHHDPSFNFTRLTAKTVRGRFAAVVGIGGGRFFDMEEFTLILLAIAGFFISIFIVPFLLGGLLSLAGKKYGEKEPIFSICQKFTGLIFTFPLALLALLPLNLLMDEFHISTDKNMSLAYALALAVPFRALLFAFIAWTMAWPPRKFASLPVTERSNDLAFFGYLVVSYIIQQVW